MIEKGDKIRLELTRIEDIEKIVQIESDNSKFIGQYDIDTHRTVIESDDEMHLSVYDNSDNSLIGHISSLK